MGFDLFLRSITLLVAPNPVVPVLYFFVIKNLYKGNSIDYIGGFYFNFGLPATI